MTQGIKNDIEKIAQELNEFKDKVKGKTFLVTGGAGFLGSWICDVIVSMGGNVICIDNLSSGRKENLEHLMEKENFTFIKDDVSKENFIYNPLIKNSNIDYVLHLAARADPKDYMKYPIETMMADSFGTYHALELALKNGALFYFSSTSEIYGDPIEHPQKEEH